MAARAAEALAALASSFREGKLSIEEYGRQVKLVTAAREQQEKEKGTVRGFSDAC